MNLTLNLPEDLAMRVAALPAEDRFRLEEALRSVISAVTFTTAPNRLLSSDPLKNQKFAAFLAENAGPGAASADKALFDSWVEDDDDEPDFETLKANLNANRAATGEEPIF